MVDEIALILDNFQVNKCLVQRAKMTIESKAREATAAKHLLPVWAQEMNQDQCMTHSFGNFSGKSEAELRKFVNSLCRRRHRTKRLYDKAKKEQDHVTSHALEEQLRTIHSDLVKIKKHVGIKTRDIEEILCFQRTGELND